MLKAVFCEDKVMDVADAWAKQMHLQVACAVMKAECW